MIAKTGVAAEDTDISGAMTPPDILHMRVVDSVFEFAQEFYVIDALVTKMGGVIVETEPAMILNRFQCTMRRGYIERDFGRVYLEREIDVETVERFEDRNEPFAEIIESLLNELLACWRKGVPGVPDASPGDTWHDSGKFKATGWFRIDEVSCGLRRLDHLFRCALANPFGVSIFPDLRRQNRLVPFIDIVADSLSDQVVGDGERGQPIVRQKLPAIFAIILGFGRGIHIEVIAPAGEFEPVKPHALRQRSKVFQWEIGPLAGEQGDWSSHIYFGG